MRAAVPYRDEGAPVSALFVPRAPIHGEVYELCVCVDGRHAAPDTTPSVLPVSTARGPGMSALPDACPPPSVDWLEGFVDVVGFRIFRWICLTCFDADTYREPIWEGRFGFLPALCVHPAESSG